MTTLLSTDDTCVSTAGSGMATTWTLSGTTAVYVDNYGNTDGYQIVASLTWQALATV